MQFEMNHKVGADYSIVILQGHLSAKVLESMFSVFEKLGGESIENTWDKWKFPKHITSQVIEEVIRNTCYVCGGLMKDDYHEEMKDSIKYSTAIRKCSSCGHSHT